MDKNDIAASLAKTPGWESKNAFEMTKLCCKELTLQGQQIGGWTNIREIIGKGSSNDITRGITAYLQEQAQMLYDMQGFVKGVPDELAPHILGFWKCAIEHAAKELTHKEQGWKNEKDRLISSLSAMESERSSLIDEKFEYESTIEELTKKNAELADRFKTEQIKHELTEQQLEASNKELANQRNTLRQALESAQKELNLALDRLEAAEKHALMEVNRTKSDYEARINVLDSKMASLRQEHTLELERHSLNAANLKNKVVSLEQEKNGLKDRLLRSEQQVDKLMVGMGGKRKIQAKGKDKGMAEDNL